MTFSSRQMLGAAAVVVVAVAVGFLAKEAAVHLMIVGLAGAAAVLFAASGHPPPALSELPEAIRLASRGDAPPGLAAGASAELVRVHEQIRELAEQTRRDRTAARAGLELFDQVEAALREALEGRRTPPPAGMPVEARALFERIEAVAAATSESRERWAARAAALKQALAELESSSRKLGEALRRRAQLASDATTSARDVASALRAIGNHLEGLTSSAEEAAASIVEMTTTHDEVVSSIAELSASVRETASSIEEMTYSIKEVAKNIDALSLTAEETSSSMNEMDISIDQVQSNANETARLSEEVAQDAERGAEAILKTIGEIYRIKESTQEAVAVIANLGSRIDAIGQILNVIDDVAEQTNLLALNAAIIAAQAGEHGKGFAVVADEIKDLAERAGASTKEIAELTKTIQNESRNAIAAVERGAKNVDRGVEVSNDAERALKKILESSQKSTNMVRAIARATVEQAKGSKQVTDAIGRIAETVQQIAAATGQQARGSELIMKSAEKMRTITQGVERSSQEQARSGRQVTQAIESISGLVGQVNQAHRSLVRTAEGMLASSADVDALLRDEESLMRQLGEGIEPLRAAGSAEPGWSR